MSNFMLRTIMLQTLLLEGKGSDVITLAFGLESYSIYKISACKYVGAFWYFVSFDFFRRLRICRIMKVRPCIPVG